jgi:hypothetical protein
MPYGVYLSIINLSLKKLKIKFICGSLWLNQAYGKWVKENKGALFFLAIEGFSIFF